MKKVPPKKRIVRRGEPPKTRPQTKPQCPMHQRDMKFDPLRNRWRCPVTLEDGRQCAMTATPADRDFDPRKPTILEGECEYLVLTDGKAKNLYLRHTESNVMILIPVDHLLTAQIETNSGTGAKTLTFTVMTKKVAEVESE